MLGPVWGGVAVGWSRLRLPEGGWDPASGPQQTPLSQGLSAPCLRAANSGSGMSTPQTAMPELSPADEAGGLAGKVGRCSAGVPALSFGGQERTSLQPWPMTWGMPQFTHPGGGSSHCFIEVRWIKQSKAELPWLTQLPFRAQGSPGFIFRAGIPCLQL